MLDRFQAQSLDNDWHWQANRIRCALAPDDPWLLERFVSLSSQHFRHGRAPAWRAQEVVFRLLLDTAADQALPWHWRCLCLDHAYRPLWALRSLATDTSSRKRLQGLQRRLSSLVLLPSLDFHEPQEGMQRD
ncbi:hypothetical protein [Metapseudomonas resinovorans]|uniref:FagA protein n=1 Tax=Metapseudomonas resinovorans NBRC 106553 TaxID=1245471 RepID=S6ACV4_METRE|nr:hypothetical protein [Pseudomonas resinovorans]BAN46752.1 hypothetical protein PCA10_10200 [Pseudomonas resinovorans NBRC 106553]